MSDDIKRIDIAEFRRLGFLQELNRQFLHPLGLALEVHIDKRTGHERLGGVWDYRDDPEGITYEGELPDPRKAEHVAAERAKHAAARRALFGAVVQPLAACPEDTTDDN